MRRLHTSRIRPATPSVHVTAGPPPQPPRSRFWKNVTVKTTRDGYQIFLDSRPVRTTQILTIPLTKPHLATAIALEWDLLTTSQQALKQHYIPLTSSTSRAIDISRDPTIRESIVKMAMGYLDTDTLLCWAGSDLRKMQAKAAAPIINHLQKLWNVELIPALDENSFSPKPQPDKTRQTIQTWILNLTSWELAAFERACLATKSLCIAARLLLGEFTMSDAAHACTLEVQYQTNIWGEVEDTHDVDREDLRRQLGTAILLAV